MKTYKYILLAALAGSMASCSDFLDVQPVGKMIPTEVTQFEKLLNNTTTVDRQFMDNNRGCSYAMLGDNLQISETQAIANYTATFPNLDLLAAYIFYQPMLNPNSTPMWWSYMWTATAYFNNVIDGVSAIDSESDYSKGVIAQARAGRAWQIMNAALFYGPMYNPAGANDTKVLPLRTSGDPTVANGPLATTAELFAQVKEDLDYACNNAPLNVVNPSRASRAAAYALRAEYDMYIRDWDAMKTDAQEAWRLAVAERGSVDNMIYNYADFYYEQVSDIDPNIDYDPRYEMEFRGPDNRFDQTDQREILLYRTTPYGSSSSKFYPSEDLLSIFDREKDLRFIQFYMLVPGYTTTKAGVSYKDDNHIAYLKDGYMMETQGLSCPLLLITKAEAEARTDNLSEALASLNLLRKYRYAGTDTDLPGGASLTQDQLLNEILAERRREQFPASKDRTFDLKRFAYDTGKPWCKTTITHKIGDKTYTASISDPIFQSLPIDNAILKYNPEWGIEQSAAAFAPQDAW